VGIDAEPFGGAEDTAERLVLLEHTEAVGGKQTLHDDENGCRDGYQSGHHDHEGTTHTAEQRIDEGCHPRISEDMLEMTGKKSVACADTTSAAAHFQEDIVFLFFHIFAY
jgi:hypothetical protein